MYYLNVLKGVRCGKTGSDRIQKLTGTGLDLEGNTSVSFWRISNLVKD